ncbi:MAG: ATP-dependent Clp protease adaptor ClpS [Candidatus Obscuribacter sp.]|jgi:ATP-dependent Clp protease adaptor protein ClpS|nr:ATP-dependent Clp protease adaptor ClpS [Candidatus Obscuribacter sp.]MBP6349713.1 ATP-dependent Clp protease adaptor ClpS [Candidatus Obscuribacter sp.]
MSGTKREGQGGSSTVFADESKDKPEKPPLFKVLLHNDDYTTMEFVVYILESIFFRPPEEAHKIMMAVHQRGVGVAGVYTYEIAEAKVEKTMRLARAKVFPLRLTIQEE